VSFLARRSFFAASALCLALLMVTNSRGNTWIWTGEGGANGNWNNSANWGSAGTPANGDTVVFQGSAGLNNTNNFTNLTLNQIHFINGGFNLYGNAFTVTNTILATNFTGSVAIYNTLTNGTANLFLLISNNITLTLRGNLNGPGGVTKAGLGTVTYNGPGNNDYTGTTLVSAGTLLLNVGGGNAFLGPLVIGDGTGTGTPVVRDLQFQEIPDTGSVTVNLYGLLDLNDFAETIGSLTLQGSTVSTPSGTGTLTLNGNLTTTGAAPIIYGNLAFNTTPTITVDGGSFPSFFIIANINDNGHGLIFTNLVPSVSEPDVDLERFGTITGPIVVNNMILEDEFGTALGATNPVTLNNSTLVFGYSTYTNKTLTLENGSGLESDAITTWGGPIILDGDATIFSYYGGQLDLAGPITGTGDISVTTAPGTNFVLELSGSDANTFDGDLYMQSGTLELEKDPFDGAIPNSLFLGDATHSATNIYLAYNQINNNGAVTLNGSSVMNLNNFYDGIGSLVLDNGTVTMGTGFLDMYSPATIVAPVGGGGTVNGILGLQANTTFLAAGSVTVGARVYGGGNLIKSDTGALSLTASNTFTGATIVQQGFVILKNSWGLGSTNSPVVVSNTATLELGGAVYVTNKTLVLNGPGAVSDFGALDVESGVNVWAGPVTVNANSTLDAWQAGSQLHINGAISGPAGLECFGYGLGGGTHFFEGYAPNTYTGLTTIDAGSTLELAKTVAVTSVAGNVVVNGELALGSDVQLTAAADVLVNAGGLFSFGPYYDFINTLRGYGSVTFGTDGYTQIGAVGGSSEFDGTISGIGYPGGYTIEKAGGGTFSLTGTNTYLNETVVDGGVLIVDGQQLQSPVMVSTSGILTGSGVVGNITSSGTVAPGNGGPAILTCSNLTFTSSGSYSVDLTGPAPGSGYAQLNQIGPGPSDVLGNASLQVVPNFATPVGLGQQFTIISNATAQPFSGTFAGLPEGAQFMAGGFTFRISYVGGTGNDVVLTLLGVPGKTVTLDAVATGWYDSTGYHASANMNYLAGSDGTGPSYRNFFVFNAPVSTNAVVHAELLVNDYIVVNPGNQDTFLVRKVATPVPTLVASWTGQTPIFNDLATGAVYSVRSIATNESGQVAIIPLNAQFINDLTAASGGLIALGGSVANLDPANPASQYVFGLSAGGPGDVRLRLVYGTNQLVNSADHGWYASSGVHAAGNEDYIAGYYDGETYRDYFLFDLPHISGELVDAQLLLNAYEVDSTNGNVAFQLYDVTNAITQLTNNQSSATSIYADLGSGLIYGGRDIYTNESSQTAVVPLDQAFLAAAQAAGSGPIALGGAVTSLTGSTSNQDVFAFSTSSSASDARLWLGYYTTPVLHPTFSPAPLDLGGGLYQFSLTGTAGITNEIQGSFDFQRWDYIADVPMGGGSGTFISTNNSVLPYRFYRAEPLQ
jgi:autotransporter-associated beta strand protein